MKTTMAALDVDALLAKLRTDGCVSQFKPDPIPEATLQRILEAGCQTPSPWNLHPWQFVVVRSAEGRARVLRHCSDAGAAATAPVLLAALGDPGAWKRAPERLAELVRSGSLAPGQEAAQLQRIQRRWSEGDAARLFTIARTHAAVQQIHLVALAYDLCTCWVQEFDAAPVARTLHIPATLLIVGLLGLGYSAEDTALPPPALARMVFAEAYGLPWIPPGQEKDM
jgi:nitroreductase